MVKSKNFLQHAVKHPGAFTSYCKRKGFKGVNSKCIQMGKKSKNLHVKRMANFAKMARRLPEPGHHNK
jgi:hypothetical protein